MNKSDYIGLLLVISGAAAFQEGSNLRGAILSGILAKEEKTTPEIVQRAYYDSTRIERETGFLGKYTAGIISNDTLALALMIGGTSLFYRRKD